MKTSFDTILFENHFENGSELTTDQKDAIVSVIGERCRANTKERLYRRLGCLGVIKRVGIFSRLMISDNDCHYVAGQSYVDEIRTVRECILD